MIRFTDKSNKHYAMLAFACAAVMLLFLVLAAAPPLPILRNLWTTDTNTAFHVVTNAIGLDGNVAHYLNGQGGMTTPAGGGGGSPQTNIPYGDVTNWPLMRWPVAAITNFPAIPSAQTNIPYTDVTNWTLMQWALSAISNLYSIQLPYGVITNPPAIPNAQTNISFNDVTNRTAMQLPYGVITNPPTIPAAQTNIAFGGVTNWPSMQWPIAAVTNISDLKPATAGTADTALAGWPTTWDAGSITTGTISLARLPSYMLTNNQVGPIQLYGDANKTNGWYYSGSGVLTSNAVGSVQIGGGSVSATVGFNGNGAGMSNAVPHAVACAMTGIGGPIPLGLQGAPVKVNYSGTIYQAHLLSAVAGSITVDIWKTNNAIPVSANSIVNGATSPALSTATLYTDSTLTSWTTAVSSNDVFIFNVTGTAPTVTNAQLELWIK